MELLCELLEMREPYFLIEDLGNLRTLKLGKMINALKQSYHVSQGRHGNVHYGSGEVKNKFERYRTNGIGPDSEIKDVAKPIKSWSDIRRAYVDFNPVFYVLQVGTKPVMMIIGDVTAVGQTVGVAWNFIGIDEDVTPIIKTLCRVSKGYSDEELKNDSKTSRTHLRHKPWDEKEPPGKIQNYEGAAQQVRDLKPAVEEMIKLFGDKLNFRLVLKDPKAMKKTQDRWKNPKVDREDLKLFADDIQKRLKLYKNSKIESVDDLKTFVEKVFSGSGKLKKINFAGRTYNAVPGSSYSTSSNEMKSLLSGKTITISFEADREVGDYNSLYLDVKFVNGMIVPVSAKYNNITEKF